MKQKSTLTLIIVAVFALAAFLSTVSAQSVTSGVSKGQTIDYSYNIIWTSNDPSAVPSAESIEFNNTQTIEFRITDVSSSTVSLDFFRYFKNGTMASQSGTINLDSGTSNVPYGFLIIGANIDKDQKVYPSGGHQIITDTVTRSYSSGQRETNVISGGDSSEKMTTYFDKATGVAVDYTYDIYTHNGNYLTTSTEKMITTNADTWTTTIPEYSILPVAIILIVVSLATLVLAKRRTN
jgi:hypothetical protein